MKRILRWYFGLPTWIVLVALIMAEITYNIMLRLKVFSDQVFFNSLGEVLTWDEIQRGLDIGSSLTWLLFGLIILSVILQIFLISFCFNVGALLMKYEISFRKMFDIVTKAFVAFTLSHFFMLAIVWGREIQRFEDFGNAPRLALLDLFADKNAIPSYMDFPLQTLSVWQLIFIILVALGLLLQFQKNLKRWLLFASSTYGISIMVWIIAIVFILYLEI